MYPWMWYKCHIFTHSFHLFQVYLYIRAILLRLLPLSLLGSKLNQNVFLKCILFELVVKCMFQKISILPLVFGMVP